MIADQTRKKALPLITLMKLIYADLKNQGKGLTPDT